jgi:hypothetical protein
MRFPLSEKIFPWKKNSAVGRFLFSRIKKIERWGGAMRKKRTDAGNREVERLIEAAKQNLIFTAALANCYASRNCRGLGGEVVKGE